MPFANVEFGTVARAYEAVSFQFTVAEGTSIMGAKVFDAEDVSIQMDQDDKSFFNFEGYGYIGLQFAKLTNVMKDSIADDGFLVSA